MPRHRYQTVYVDMDQTSYDHAQSICENFGSGLATILDQLNFETLNTTLQGINAQEYCGQRMYLGATTQGSFAWSWRRGVSISSNWEHWAPNNPNINGLACMRMGVDSTYWMKMFDNDCTNNAYWIPQFKCCICDTLP